jgi:hypothetical protein
MSWNLIVATMLAAAPAEPAEPPRLMPATVEVSFATHAGEGAEGRKRFGRDGCYQVESGGGTGGAGYARDSQAGCLLPADVAAVFAKLAAIPGDALVREKPARASTTGGARAQLEPGGSNTTVVLIRRDGSRWVAANRATADDILRAVNELPSENQWHAKAPAKPVGTGPQLVVLSATGQGRIRTEATLASDGRWWCYRSAIGSRGDVGKLPEKPVKPLAPEAAATLLRRFLYGVRPDGTGDAPARVDHPPIEASVEVAWPARERAPVRAPALSSTITVRFGAQMSALSPACAIAKTGPE